MGGKQGSVSMADSIVKSYIKLSPFATTVIEECLTSLIISILSHLMSSALHGREQGSISVTRSASADGMRSVASAIEYHSLGSNNGTLPKLSSNHLQETSNSSKNLLHETQ